MSYFNVIMTLVSILTSVINYFKERKLVTQAQLAMVEAALRKQADEIAKANAARQRARDEHKRMPDNDDGFRLD